MIAGLPRAGRPIRVLFCACGQRGGSVRQLYRLIRDLDRSHLTPGLISYYRDQMAAPLFRMDGLFCRYKIPIAPAGVPDMMKRVGRVFLPTPFALQYHMLAAYVLRRHRPDVIHINNLPAQHLPVLRVARRLGIPVLCHLRATRPLSVPDRKGLPWIHRFIALSKAGKKHYMTEGLAEESIRVVYNTMPLDTFDQVLDTGDSASLPPGYTYVTQVGTLNPNKRSLVAVKAFHIAREVCPKLRLVLIGEGRDRPAIDTYIRANGLVDDVLMLGSRADVPVLLRDSHIGMLLSNNEGLANVILEYMAASLPVVATELAAIDEMVVRDKSALVVGNAKPATVAEALITLYNDPDLRGRMGTLGRHTLEHSPFVRQGLADDIGEQILEVARS